MSSSDTIVLCILILLLHGPHALSDEAVDRKRSIVQSWLDRLPADAETLVVLQAPYEIPSSGPSGALDMNKGFRELHLNSMFPQESRKVLAGSTINLWIEASWRFRSPDFPEEIPVEDLTGWGLKYDGCHVLAFDPKSAPDVKVLFEKLLETVSDSVKPERHVVEGHEAIAYSNSYLARKLTRSARETPELTKKIKAALSHHFWIASPQTDLLVIATSEQILANALRDKRNSKDSAFPANLREWTYLRNGDAPLWGMRHFQSPANGRDLSDFRREDGVATGIAFTIDAAGGSAKIAFIECNESTAMRLKGQIRLYVDADATFSTESDGTLVANIRWPSETPVDSQKRRSQLASWLISHLGHAFVL